MPGIVLEIGSKPGQRSYEIRQALTNRFRRFIVLVASMMWQRERVRHLKGSIQVKAQKQTMGRS
jgi:hypothetical protein